PGDGVRAGASWTSVWPRRQDHVPVPRGRPGADAKPARVPRREGLGVLRWMRTLPGSRPRRGRHLQLRRAPVWDLCANGLPRAAQAARCGAAARAGGGGMTVIEQNRAALAEIALGNGHPPSPARRPSVARWPAPLAEEAWHGLAGEIVRALEPHTE